jgi:LemA protein
MWILSLEWLLLAVLVFWSIGALKRLKRLRVQGKKAFEPVDAHFTLVLALLRECGPEVTEDPSFLRHARSALLPSADLLDAALQQARQHPLRPEVIASLDSTWQSLQVAWRAYAQLSESTQACAPADAQAWTLRWQELDILCCHSMAQFNTAVLHYNQAIAQIPVCVVARIFGFKPGRIFQKDAALLMQP